MSTDKTVRPFGLRDKIGYAMGDFGMGRICEFDPNTGDFVQDFGGQGYGKGSSWSRGQGWGLCGFTASFKHTGKQEYLDTAKKIAAYILPLIPENGLLPCDFRQPAEPWVQDDIAAGVIASALLDLAELVPKERETYLKAALKILHALDEQSADWSQDTDHITLNGTAGYHLPGRKKTTSTPITILWRQC